MTPAITVCDGCGDAFWADRKHDCLGAARCQQCDGDGRIWNNADPTSGQWVDCECASGMEARQGGDGETRLHRDDDSPTAESGDAQTQSSTPDNKDKPNA